METKLTPTDGTWHNWEASGGGHQIKVNNKVVGLILLQGEEGQIITETRSNAELICDAGNTFQKCHLLPSQLLQQRDELMSLLGRCKHFVVVHYCETPSSESELIINEIQKHQT